MPTAANLFAAQSEIDRAEGFIAGLIEGRGLTVDRILIRRDYDGRWIASGMVGGSHLYAKADSLPAMFASAVEAARTIEPEPDELSEPAPAGTEAA